MPTGVRLSDEKRQMIVRLLSEGLRPVQVAAQVGLCPETIYKLRIKLKKAGYDGYRDTTKGT